MPLFDMCTLYNIYIPTHISCNNATDVPNATPTIILKQHSRFFDFSTTAAAVTDMVFVYSK